MLQGQVERLTALALGAAVDPGEAVAPPGRRVFPRVQCDLPVAEPVLHLPLAVVGDLDDDLAAAVDHGRLADVLADGVERVRQGLERRPPADAVRPAVEPRAVVVEHRDDRLRAPLANAFSASVAGDGDVAGRWRSRSSCGSSVTVASGAIDSETRSSQTASPSQAKCMR